MGVDALDVRQHGDGGQSDQVPEQVSCARGRMTGPHNWRCEIIWASTGVSKFLEHVACPRGRTTKPTTGISVIRPNLFRPAWAVRGYRPIVASSSEWQKFWRSPSEIQPDPPKPGRLENLNSKLENLNSKLGLNQFLLGVLVIAVIVLSVLVWRMNNRIECLERPVGVSTSPYTVSYHSHSC